MTRAFWWSVPPAMLVALLLLPPATSGQAPSTGQLAGQLAASLGVPATSVEVTHVREEGSGNARRIVFTYRITSTLTSMAHLRRHGLNGLADYFKERATAENSTASAVLAEYNLSARQARGLAAIEASYAASGSRNDVDDILDLPARYRNQLFNLAGRLAERGVVGEGLARAIDRGLPGEEKGDRKRRRPNEPGFLAGVQGLLGQLHAAITLMEDYAVQGGPRVTIDFEVTLGADADRREVDLIVNVGGRRLFVEVKTNLKDGPTCDKAQIRKDLRRHAANGWEDMLYLYAPQQAGNLDKVKDTFRAQLNGLLRDAAFREEMKKLPRYRDVLPRRLADAVRADLEKRLEDGMVRCFRYSGPRERLAVRPGR